MSIYVAVTVCVAAPLALTGTNAQARVARESLFENEDPLIAAAARTWRPVGWLASRKQRDARQVAEAAVKPDPERWRRYRRLCVEPRALNALESSVALGISAAFIAGDCKPYSAD